MGDCDSHALPHSSFRSQMHFLLAIIYFSFPFRANTRVHEHITTDLRVKGGRFKVFNTPAYKHKYAHSYPVPLACLPVAFSFLL